MRGAVRESRRARDGGPRRGPAAHARARARPSIGSATTWWRAPPLGRDRRVVLGGHLDTVPANGNAVPRRDGDTLHGLGSADMKGGLAVMLTLAEACSARADAARFDATFVFYVGEEIAEEWNGLRDLFARRPSSWPATSPSCSSRPRGGSRPGARARSTSEPPTAALAPTRPGPGWASTRSTAPPRRSVGSRRPIPAPSTSTGWSTARRCRPCASRAASPTTWSRTSAASS